MEVEMKKEVENKLNMWILMVAIKKQQHTRGISDNANNYNIYKNNSSLLFN